MFDRMKPLFEPGRLALGCNYWSSRHGLRMWRNWDPESAEADLDAFASAGITVLRVFPAWDDFQNLGVVYGYGGTFDRFINTKIGTVPDSPESEAALDPEMIGRFRTFCGMAEKRRLSLIVSLVTGWMSGIMLVPEAFRGKELQRDPECIRAQVRFVREFVRRTKDCPAVGAWEPGNECNCMDHAGSPAQAWLWTNAIVSAIRLEDPSREVFSGMHGLGIHSRSVWSIPQQAELTDALTTHPYPLFTPKCATSPLNEIPAAFHAAAESKLYSELGGKPCFAEEAGSLGAMISSPERTAGYMRVLLASSWAHDLRAMLWWCGFDLDKPGFPPYSFNAMERGELGIFHSDRSPSRFMRELPEFRKKLDALPFRNLPPAETDAVCLLAHDSCWEDAFGSFTLSLQAGFNLRFADPERGLPDSPFYLAPSLRGFEPFRKDVWNALLEKIRAGAVLFATRTDGTLQPFDPVFGCHADSFCSVPETRSIVLNGKTLTVHAPCSARLVADSCRVLARDDSGMPVMTANRFGKGLAVLLDPAPEADALQPGNSLFEFYSAAAEYAGLKLPFLKKSPSVGITRHRSGGTEILVAVNYSARPAELVLRAKQVQILIGKGTDGKIVLGPDDFAVLQSGKKEE